jgi:hypothetical protein
MMRCIKVICFIRQALAEIVICHKKQQQAGAAPSCCWLLDLQLLVGFITPADQ